MTAHKCPSGSQEDDCCPKPGGGSAENGKHLPPVEDAKTPELTERDDWFPLSEWPSSGSNSGSSTGGQRTQRCPGTHETPVHLEQPVVEHTVAFSTKSRALLRKSSTEGNCFSTQENVLPQNTVDSAQEILQNAGAVSASLSFEGSGSPRASTIASALKSECAPVRGCHLPQCTSSPISRIGAKRSLVCGPVSVQQTLTERQLDIEKRMLEVRQQNRRRLLRRQQEAKEQQMQRMKEHRAALLARKERIKLASLWKERGMAAAARPSTTLKARRTTEELPSDNSQLTENPSRGADELLAALVMSESISLQTDLGSAGDDASVDLARKETCPPFSFRCPGDLPDERTGSTYVATAQPVVSVPSICHQHKSIPYRRSPKAMLQPTKEPGTVNAGASVMEVSQKSTQQSRCTLSGSLLSSQLRNKVASSQRVMSLRQQFQDTPAGPRSSSEAPYPCGRPVALTRNRRLKPGMKPVSVDKSYTYDMQQGEDRDSSLLRERECEHKSQTYRKIRPVIVVADQHLKNELDIHLQHHQQVALSRNKDKLRVTDGSGSLPFPPLRNSSSTWRPPATNSKLAEEDGALGMPNLANLSVHKTAGAASICQATQCANPSIVSGENAHIQLRFPNRSKQGQIKTRAPSFTLKERLISCRLANFGVPEMQALSSPISSGMEVPGKEQAEGLQVVRIRRDIWCEKGLSNHELENVGSSDSHTGPCKTFQLHENGLLGTKDRYIMHFPSSHGDSDGSSAATKPQEDDVNTRGGHTKSNGLEDRIDMCQTALSGHYELIGDEKGTVSAVWALQKAEVEEEKRLLLLEMSHHAIEKQAEARRRGKKGQPPLLAQHLRTRHCIRPETDTGCSQLVQKTQPCAEASSLVVHPVDESLMSKAEFHIPQNFGDTEVCKNLPDGSHAPLPVPKEGNMQASRAVPYIHSTKNYRGSPASRPFNVSSGMTRKPKLRTFAPSKNLAEISRQAETTVEGDEKVHHNGQPQELQSDFPLMQQQALIAQLLGHGVLAGLNGGSSATTKAAEFQSDSCLPSCGFHDKYDTSPRIRTIKRRTMLQALQHLLLFPSKSSHRITLKKANHLGKEGNTSQKETQKQGSKLHRQRRLPTEQPWHSAYCPIEKSIPEGSSASSRLFCRSSSSSSGAAGQTSLLSTAGNVE